MAYGLLPAVMRAFDRQPSADVHEAVPTQILWACLAYLPSLGPSLGLPAGLAWDRGRHGVGDLVGLYEASQPIRAHVEVKSSGAKASWGWRCPHGCNEWRSQFAHMAHDLDAALLVITQTSRIHAVHKMAADAEVGERVRVISFAKVADEIEDAIAIDGEPAQPLVAALLDVEREAA